MSSWCTVSQQSCSLTSLFQLSFMFLLVVSQRSFCSDQGPRSRVRLKAFNEIFWRFSEMSSHIWIWGIRGLKPLKEHVGHITGYFVQGALLTRGSMLSETMFGWVLWVREHLRRWFASRMLGYSTSSKNHTPHEGFGRLVWNIYVNKWLCEVQETRNGVDLWTRVFWRFFM